MSLLPHIDPSALAQLADGTLAEEDAYAVRTHLAGCRTCMATYADVVRYRAAWLTDSNAFRLDDQDLVEAALGVGRPRGLDAHRLVEQAAGLRITALSTRSKRELGEP